MRLCPRLPGAELALLAGAGSTHRATDSLSPFESSFFANFDDATRETNKLINCDLNADRCYKFHQASTFS